MRSEILVVAAMLAAGCGDSRSSDAFESAGITGANTDGNPGGGQDDPGDPGGASDGSGGDSGADDDAPGGGLKLDVGAGETDGGVGDDYGGDGCLFIDVLFVVDISASMGEEQANLAANFPAFVSVLDEYVADPTKPATGYRVGVTNSTVVNNNGVESTMGLDGALYGGNGIFQDCGLAGELWMDGPAPGLNDTFSCLANGPKSDCMSCSDNGKERPLDVMEMFVDKSAPGGPNDGFYRGEDSLLVIVNLTDEDDDIEFTTTTPSATKAKLDAFAGGDERYVLVTIAGPQASGCNSNFGSATPAPRLHEFTGLAPNGLMGDICQGDLAQPLADALDLIQSTCDTLPPPEG